MRAYNGNAFRIVTERKYILLAQLHLEFGVVFLTNFRRFYLFAFISLALENRSFLSE